MMIQLIVDQQRVKLINNSKITKIKMMILLRLLKAYQSIILLKKMKSK